MKQVYKENLSLLITQLKYDLNRIYTESGLTIESIKLSQKLDQYIYMKQIQMLDARK